MRWAIRRQLLYALLVLTVLVGLGGGGWYLFIYTPPSCTDNVLNQDEEGVDCGGVCLKLCRAPRVSALWSRAVMIAPGVYHAVALVRNPESNAATGNLPYSFTLFDSKNILIAQRDGMMRLDAAEIVPLVEPNIVTGERIPARAFVTLGTGNWQRAERKNLPVTVISKELDKNALRLSATIENESAVPVLNLGLTALLYDENDVLVTASQTTIDQLAARERREVTFTWQVPFTPDVVRFDVIPRLR